VISRWLRDAPAAFLSHLASEPLAVEVVEERRSRVSKPPTHDPLSRWLRSGRRRRTRLEATDAWLAVEVAGCRGG